nr:histidine kinase [Micromonospora sp. DSM 115978]
MRAWSRWWRTRSKPQRYDLLTRATMYPYPVIAPVVLVGVSAGLPAPGRVLVVALGVAQAVVCLLLIRAGIAHYLGRRRPPTALLAGSVALGVAVGLAAVLSAVVAGQRLSGPSSAAMGVSLLAATVLLVAICVSVRPRYALLGAVGAVVSLLMVGVVDRAPAEVLLTVGWTVVVVYVAVLFSYRCSLWMLGVVWELDRSRGVQARLAVAEERLRFARDLHDVLGRNLSVVALKAELAAQLARRGRAEAVDEMLEVRRLAQESLTEVREVVRGYRAANLSAELAGARAVLASAGVRCQVLGDDQDLPEPAQDALGWVVREGITNVLRHSEASRCTIAVRRTPGSGPLPAGAAAGGSAGVVLTMENDGVPAGTPAGLGNGLLGLRERLATLGGTVTAGPTGRDLFRLTGALPIPDDPRPVATDGTIR